MNAALAFLGLALLMAGSVGRVEHEAGTRAPQLRVLLALVWFCLLIGYLVGRLA